jgi:hypothetical protein
MADDAPYVGMSSGEKRRVLRGRDLRKREYEDTTIDEAIKGFFGKQSAGGSVLDPDRAARVRANDAGQLSGIALDALDLPKAGLTAALPALAGALRKGTRAGEAGGEIARRTREFMGSERPGGMLADALRSDRPVAAAKDTTGFLEPLPATPTVQAPREINADKRYKSGDKAGIYRGTEAFGGITPQQLGPRRKDYIADAEAGAPHSKYWYDDTSKAIFDLVGGKADDADRLAHALSVTSSSTPVGSNAMYGFKAWNQDAVGDAVRTGKYPTAMSEDIVRGWSGEDVARGLKRDPYKAGLSVHWRPDPDLRPTNDIHQMRAWGVKDASGKPWSQGVGEAGHRFIDEQSRYATNALNERAAARGEPADWNNYRTQAAAWAPQRVKTGQAETLEDAAKHYGDFVDDYSAHVTREWVPGETSKHLPELLRDPAAKDKYSRSMEEVVQGPQGIDALAHSMGALSSPTLENRGVYEGVVSPGQVSRIPVGKSTGSHDIDPSSDRLLRAVAAAHGLVGTQDQVAYNFLTGKPSNRGVGGFRFERSMPGVKDPEVRELLPFSQDELTSLAGKLPPGVDIPQADPRGARALFFDEPYDAEAQGYQLAARLGGGLDAPTAQAATRNAFKEEDSARRQLVNQLRATAGEFNAELVPHERSSALFPVKEGSTWEKPDQWSAKPFIAGVEQGGPKVVEGFDAAMQTMAPQLLQRTEQMAAQHGWTQAPWYGQMMNALGTGGLGALKELVAKGVVPVAVLSTLGAVAAGAGDQPD